MKRIFLAMALAIGMGCAAVAAELPAVKYVFFFIGDGMGPNQVELARLANGGTLKLLSLPVAGQLITHNAKGEVTDSAASGTALACGTKTFNGALGVDLDSKPLVSVAETAKKQGWRVGILTSVNPNHATPAAFYAKVGSRGQVDDITGFIIPSGFDLIGGTALLSGSDEARQGKEKELANAGYKLVRSPEELAAASPAEKVRIEVADVFQIDGPGIRLPEIVAAAIDYLGAGDAPFFLMVEGGKIDYAGHGNNATAMIQELLQFDDAVGKAMVFAQAHPEETLIVVTADHETGGLQLDPEKFAAQDPDEVKAWMARVKTDVDEAAWGIRWTTTGHSNANVPLRASGPGMEVLAGYHENTVPANTIRPMIQPNRK